MQSVMSLKLTIKFMYMFMCMNDKTHHTRTAILLNSTNPVRGWASFVGDKRVVL